MDQKCYKIIVYQIVRVVRKDGTVSDHILHISDNCPIHEHSQDRLYLYSNDCLNTNDSKFIPERSANIEKFTNKWTSPYIKIPQELWLGFLLLISRGEKHCPVFDWSTIKSIHIRYASYKEPYENPFSRGLKKIKSWLKGPEPVDHKED